MVSTTNHTFTLTADPTISSVEILGTFSSDTSEHWQVATPLTLQDGKYTATIDGLLPNHQYMYKYKINGAWQLDPSEPTVKDGAGNTNNLLTLDNSADLPKKDPTPATGIAILSASNDICVPTTKEKKDMMYMVREGEQPGDVKLEHVIAEEIISKKDDPATSDDVVKVVPVKDNEGVVAEVPVEANTSSSSEDVKKDEEPVVAKEDPVVQEELKMEDAVVEKELEVQDRIKAEEEEAEKENDNGPETAKDNEKKEGPEDVEEKKEEPKNAEKEKDTSSSSDQNDSANTSTTSGAQTPPVPAKRKSKSKNKARNSTEAQSLQDASRPETISSEKHKPSRKSFNFHFNSYKESSGSHHHHHKRGTIKELFKKIFH